MAGKDSYGKMFIFLRAFMSNEKGWMFMHNNIQFMTGSFIHKTI